MTRRHDALIPLTHDHHHALRNARRLRVAADEGAEERLSAARAFADFFRKHSVLHFREEEELIFPLVVRHPDAPMDGIVRILTEHVRIHSLVADLERQIAANDVAGETMRELAQTLHGHVRFEEDELFPSIERLVSTELTSVKLAERDRSDDS